MIKMNGTSFWFADFEDMNVSGVSYQLFQTPKTAVDKHGQGPLKYLCSLCGKHLRVDMRVDIICMFDCTRKGALLSAKYANEFARQKAIRNAYDLSQHC